MKICKVLISVFVITAIAAITSCSKSEDEEPRLSISTNEISIASSNGSSESFTIYTNSSWEISIEGDESLVTVSAMSGKGSNATISVTANQSNDSKLLVDLVDLYITHIESGEVQSISVSQRRTPAAQNTLIYFTGTSLSSYFADNIEDIESAILRGEMGDNGRIIYFLPSSSSAKLYEITFDGSSVTKQLLKTYDSTKWYYETTVVQVIADAKEIADISENDEDNNMNLIISGHGTGWVLKENSSFTKTATAGEYISYSSMWEPTDTSIPTRFMGVSTDGYMDISEITSGIEQSNTKFGYILFDECLMSSIELLYRMRNCADYIIASPAEVMSYGFPYDNILKYMFDNNGLDFNVEMICSEYVNFYTSYKYPCATIAACVTSELDGLADAISNLSLRELSSSEISSLQVFEGLTTHVFYDLGNYISTASEDDLTQYNTAFDKAFPPECRLHTTQYYSALGSSGFKSIKSYSGVTTSAPSSLFQDDWAEEPWSIASGQAN